MASVSGVTVWKAACAGQIHGTIRTSGGHFRFPRESAELWAERIKELRRARQRRREHHRRPSQRSTIRGSNSGIPNLEGWSLTFERWWRQNPVENSPPPVKRAVLELMRTPTKLALRLARDLGVKLDD